MHARSGAASAAALPFHADVALLTQVIAVNMQQLHCTHACDTAAQLHVAQMHTAEYNTTRFLFD
jgi:hypothetical protein